MKQCLASKRSVFELPQRPFFLLESLVLRASVHLRRQPSFRNPPCATTRTWTRIYLMTPARLLASIHWVGGSSTSLTHALRCEAFPGDSPRGGWGGRSLRRKRRATGADMCIAQLRARARGPRPSPPVVTSVTFSAQLDPPLDASRLAPGCFAAVTDLSAPWDKDSFSAFDRVAIDDLDQEAALGTRTVFPLSTGLPSTFSTRRRRCPINWRTPTM